MAAELERAKKILGKKEIGLLISDYTKVAFVTCHPETFDDQVYLYDDLAEAEKAAAVWKEKGEGVSVRRLEAKEYLNLFMEFMLESVNTVLFHEKGEEIPVPLTELIRKKPEEEMPKGKKLPENPALSISLMYYLQEARKSSGAQDRKKLAGMEEEILHHLVKGQFLIPAQIVKEGDKNVNRMMLVKISNGDTAFPLFTDTIAFSRTNPEKKPRLLPADLHKMITEKLPEEIKGVMINPGGLSFYLTFDMLRAAIRRFGEA